MSLSDELKKYTNILTESTSLITKNPKKSKRIIKEETHTFYSSCGLNFDSDTVRNQHETQCQQCIDIKQNEDEGIDDGRMVQGFTSECGDMFTSEEERDKHEDKCEDCIEELYYNNNEYGSVGTKGTGQAYSLCCKQFPSKNERDAHEIQCSICRDLMRASAITNIDEAMNQGETKMENNPVPGQVLNWVQGSIAEDWHQHVRGGGWVYKTAKVADSATIDKGAIIGNKTTINDWVKVGKWARIGDWVTIGEGATIGISTMISNKARIGYWARIGNKVTIGFGAKIGFRATVGNGARVGDRATIDDDASLCARGIASNGDTILAETKKSVISDEQKLANAKGSLEYLQTRLKTEKKTGADAKRKATEKEISSWNKEIEKLKEKIKKNKGNKMKIESIELKTILKLIGLKEGGFDPSNPNITASKTASVQKYFHCSRADNCDSIEEKGLLPNMMQEHTVSDGGIYLLSDFDNAVAWAEDEMLPFVGTTDIFEVTLPDNVIPLKDDHDDLNGWGSYVVYDPIPASNVKHLTRLRPDFDDGETETFGSNELIKVEDDIDEPEFEDPYANTKFVDEGKKNKAAKVCKLCGESPVYSSGECTGCFYTNHCETCDNPLGKKSKNGMCDNCIQMSESKESKKSFKQYLKEAEVTSKKKKS